MKTFSQFLKEAKGLWQQKTVYQKLGPKYAEKGKVITHPDGTKKLSYQEYYDLPKEKRIAYREKYGNVYEDFSLKPKDKNELNRRKKLVLKPIVDLNKRGKYTDRVSKGIMGSSKANYGRLKDYHDMRDYEKYKLGKKKPLTLKKYYQTYYGLKGIT